MRFRLIGALAALALLFGTLIATDSGAVRPEPLAGNSGLITPAWTPAGVGDQDVTVVVQLAGDPVAVQQGNAGRKLTRAEKDRIKGQLKGAQDAIRANIASLGGTVLAEYQSAYNGIKVRIARNKLAQLATLPGVIAVRQLQPKEPANTNGIPFIGAPTVWQNLGMHGEGVKVAIIDTGIDYTHANFGGPGTPAAYNTAHANETLPANPAYFGPGAPRVKGGTDLVGDSYNANPNDPAYQPIPHPDPNPLDCNGHGSHVAGTAAGSGVLSTGATYTGTYNGSTVSGNTWNIGPGVAPKADIYSVRVFGCAGSTDVVVDAIDWAVENDMDVINMSLGSPFGSKDDPDAVASTNAAQAGVVVVASAGNDGPNPYITGSPAAATGAISVAANDAVASFPGASMFLSITSDTVVAIDANGALFSNGTVYPIAVLRNSYPAGSVALGCSQAEYAAYPGFPASLTGKMIVTVRGTCSRVARAIFAQQNGAAAALMINNSASYPPFEGPITGSAETGPYNVTIPFFGVRGLVTTAGTDGNKVRANDGGTATATNATVVNPGFTGFASFSSGGPRNGDSALKPDITAPGVSVLSTLVGSGNLGEILSGTSMSSPHVTGVAALTVQAHPTWTVEKIKAAILNTGLPSMVGGYQTSRGGTGLVQPAKSTISQVVARSTGDKLGVSLNYGFAELKKDFTEKKKIELSNNGSSAAAFNIAQALPQGSPHSVSFDKSSVTVPGNGHAEVAVTLNVPAATAGASNGPGLSFQEVAGLVQFTPATPADNAGITLDVPYYLVPRPLSDISTAIGKLKGHNPSTTATVTNMHGVISGDADFYAWGLSDNNDNGSPFDVRAIGVQSFPISGTQAVIVFAVNTFNRWSTPSASEFDIYVDVDNDGVDDYIVVGVDDGAVRTGAFNGVMGSFVFSTRSGGASEAFLAVAPTDSSTALLPVLASQLCRTGEPCLTSANPRITYHAVSFNVLGSGSDVVTGSAKFNVWSNAISTGGFATVAPGGTDTSNTISVNSAEWAITPALGLMIVTFDNKSGEGEAQLTKVKLQK